MISLDGPPFEFDEALLPRLDELQRRVVELRRQGSLDGNALTRISKFLRLNTIYNSNAIEGNSLDFGETRRVVELGFTISGKPLKDSLEARNLAHALDYFESLASSREYPLTEVVLREIHSAILHEIDDENAGRYRSEAVEISGSAYQTTSPESIGPVMQQLGAWLSQLAAGEVSGDPVALAAAAHAWFVQIHPFIDGNGRTARILMNVLLMRSGYPIAVITKEDRFRYYEALEESQNGDLSAFLSLVVESVEEALEAWEEAQKESEAERSLAQSLAERLGAPQRDAATREYEVFKAAMDLLRSQFAEMVHQIDSAAGYGTRVFFKDFSMIELEKYLQLKNRQSAKMTWFFRVDFRVSQGTTERTARYLFWFARRQYEWTATPRPDVTVVISREEPAGSREYVTLSRMDERGRTDVPDLREIAYDVGSETYRCRRVGGSVVTLKVNELVNSFVQQVVDRNFSNMTS